MLTWSCHPFACRLLTCLVAVASVDETSAPAMLLRLYEMTPPLPASWLWLLNRALVTTVSRLDVTPILQASLSLPDDLRVQRRTKRYLGPPLTTAGVALAVRIG